MIKRLLQPVAFFEFIFSRKTFAKSRLIVTFVLNLDTFRFHRNYLLFNYRDAKTQGFSTPK
jgi:hypothetical protein